MTQEFNLTQLEAMWVLGLLVCEELPRHAATALAEGVDSEAMLQLSICLPSETEQIQRLFEQILQEGGGGKMSKIDALKHYAKQISASILSKKVSPLEGAKLIWRATINSQQREFHELDSFILNP